ncbi:MAG: hypothetical protein HY800_05715 [Ignavibacteriales bacterium]|nr:hypothetical protein [Ignavibacteriales bacterium]
MKDTMNQRVEAIKTLLGAFKYERIVYMTITVISLLVLIGSAVYLIIQSEGTTETITVVVGWFGSSGAITYTAGRLLRMWSEALRILLPLTEGEKP